MEGLSESRGLDIRILYGCACSLGIAESMTQEQARAMFNGYEMGLYRGSEEGKDDMREFFSQVMRNAWWGCGSEGNDVVRER